MEEQIDIEKLLVEASFVARKAERAVWDGKIAEIRAELKSISGLVFHQDRNGLELALEILER